MDLSEIPSFLRPRLRLFLSVDLVGSTALKQAGDFPIKKPNGEESLRELGPKWLIDLATFYRQVESRFAAEWERYCVDIAPTHQWPVCAAPNLWKVNGDELIYVRELSCSREAIAAVACWLAACVSYREELRTKGSRLDVKMSAWTAGFPLSNTEVIFTSKRGDTDDWLPEVLHYHLLERWYLETEDRSALVQDFIGPSIDTGFRIASRATPRKFAISLELALMVSTITAPPTLPKLPLQYDGQETLKGVMGGRPYPLFWIDAHQENDLSRSEDTLLGKSRLDKEKVREFCEKYMSEHDAYVFRPFIVDDPEPLFSIVPENYIEKLRTLSETWRKADDNRRAYEQSTAEPEGENADAVEMQLPLRDD